LPLALPVAVFGWQLLVFVYGRLAQRRLWPVFAAAIGTALYASHGYLPALSAHLSPREVYETFNAIAEPDAELGEYRVGGRAAAYYAKGSAREFEQIGDVVKYLDHDERRWAAFPAEELGRLNRMFRNRTGRHLFVADARNANVVLATNKNVQGRENANALADRVLSKAPPMQYPVNANLEDRVMFLGYDLKLPHGDHVGAGEEFEIIWYWKCLRSVSGNYKIFVHIDSSGQRIHGDHHAVNGDYPVRMWDRGDIIVDRQTLQAGASMRPGDYIIHLGLYSGETRMEVISGPKDDANRIKAGVLRLR
jgi:hypothetical protein